MCTIHIEVVEQTSCTSAGSNKNLCKVSSFPFQMILQ